MDDAINAGLFLSSSKIAKLVAKDYLLPPLLEDILGQGGGGK